MSTEYADIKDPSASQHSGAAAPYPPTGAAAPYPPAGAAAPYPPAGAAAPYPPAAAPYPPAGGAGAPYPTEASGSQPPYPTGANYNNLPPYPTGATDKSSSYPQQPPPPYTPGSYPNNQNIVMMPNYATSSHGQVIVTQPMPTDAVVVLRGPMVGPESVSMDCSHCNQRVTTVVEYENGACTWLFFGLCCIFGCWLGCCLIPFCMKSTKNAKHYCPRCKALVGYYNRM